MDLVTDQTRHEVRSYTEGFVITATVVDDLPDVTPGFESVANAADLAMYEVLREDLDSDELAA